MVSQSTAKHTLSLECVTHLSSFRSRHHFPKQTLTMTMTSIPQSRRHCHRSRLRLTWVVLEVVPLVLAALFAADEVREREKQKLSWLTHQFQGQ